VVTDEIDRVTSQGIALRSGENLDADLIVTATGFRIKVMGGITFLAHGRAIDPAQTVTWRGMMFTDLPNLAWVFGYLRAPWTPRVELVAGMVIRLLAHMEATGTSAAVPVLGLTENSLPRRPFIEPEDFNAGYLTRALDAMPKSLDHPEWRHRQSFLSEKPEWAAVRLDESALRFY
jgi:cation diffusion facilitator CzcD-associated flavoprotein CzcO